MSHSAKLSHEPMGPKMTDREEKMTESLVRVSVSLVAAISYVRSTPECRKAAASDAIFEQTLKDWERALNMAKAAMTS